MLCARCSHGQDTTTRQTLKQYARTAPPRTQLSYCRCAPATRLTVAGSKVRRRFATFTYSFVRELQMSLRVTLPSLKFARHLRVSCLATVEAEIVLRQREITGLVFHDRVLARLKEIPQERLQVIVLLSISAVDVCHPLPNFFEALVLQISIINELQRNFLEVRGQCQRGLLAQTRSSPELERGAPGWRVQRSRRRLGWQRCKSWQSGQSRQGCLTDRAEVERGLR
mmetsp:Transcript_44257/g.107598  ORF Transcript_44257/g.107598 Transcript_44257/m.107598 type:complete len:226 (+) Transcript_44257:316-993(+)